MDCILPSLHKLEEDGGRREADKLEQCLWKSYLSWDQRLLRPSQTPLCYWGLLINFFEWIVVMLLFYFKFFFFNDLGSVWLLQLDKAYPRDFMQRGRVRVLLKKEDGTLCNPAITSSKGQLPFLFEMEICN